MVPVTQVKFFFVKQYLNLYTQEEEEHKKEVIIVCRDDNDWINPETGEPYDGFDMCTMDMITSENIEYFENSVIVIDDMVNKLNNETADYFGGGRHDNIQMIVVGHKTGQII